MKNDFLKIIQHYGINHQQRKLTEEVFELQEAITKYESIGVYKDQFMIDNIAEEISDVCVLLRQIMAIYDISQDQVSEMIKYKVDRQIKRIGHD